MMKGFQQKRVTRETNAPHARDASYARDANYARESRTRAVPAAAIVFAAVFLTVIFAFSNAANAKSVLSVPAVDASGKGILTTIEAEVVPSNLSGVFVDTKPFVSVETQQSAELAAKIAARKANASLENKTVLFKIVADAEVVDGPSGGAALALLAYAELANKSTALRRDIAVTGSIEQDASIGKIGGLIQKTESAIAAGIKLLVIPLGQSIQQGIDLTRLGEAKGMQVVEAADFDEVLAIAFTPPGSRVTARKHVTPPLSLEPAPLVSSSASEMRELAESELANLENLAKRLNAENKNSNESKAVRQEAVEAVNTTRYLLEKNYFYSAANLAFVSNINLEAFLLANASKNEFSALLDDLQAQLETPFEKKFSGIYGKATIENWEWIAGAQTRFYWARKKARETRESLALAKTPAQLAQLVEDYLSARNWLRAAEKMAAIAGRSAGGTQANEVNARANVIEVMKAANESLSSVFDQEAEWHLEAASQAFQENNYFSASIDACFALSFSRAREKALESIGGDFNALLENASGFATREGVWAQLYFVHSLYLKEEGNRTRDFSYYFNALKLQELSKCLTANAKDFKTMLAQPPAQTTVGELPLQSTTALPTPLEVRAVIEKTLDANETIKLFLALNTVLIIALAVTLALLLRARARGREASAGLSDEERLQRLDDLLLCGRVSEKTYERLVAKYERAGERTREANKEANQRASVKQTSGRVGKRARRANQQARRESAR